MAHHKPIACNLIAKSIHSKITLTHRFVSIFKIKNETMLYMWNPFIKLNDASVKKHIKSTWYRQTVITAINFK